VKTRHEYCIRHGHHDHFEHDGALHCPVCFADLYEELKDDEAARDRARRPIRVPRSAIRIHVTPDNDSWPETIPRTPDLVERWERGFMQFREFWADVEVPVLEWKGQQITQQILTPGTTDVTPEVLDHQDPFIERLKQDELELLEQILTRLGIEVTD
jgi:hypothetical protein